MRGADQDRYGLGHILDTGVTGLHCMVMTTLPRRFVMSEYDTFVALAVGDMHERKNGP